MANSTEPAPSLSPAARVALLQRFQRRYWGLALPLAGLAVLGMAWYLHQPHPYIASLSYQQSLPLLAIAALLLNGLSFYFQNRYVRRLLLQPDVAQSYSTGGFALRFYGINLAIALALSVLGVMPLLALVFYYWIYPVILWLIPYHAILGLLLGRDLKRHLVQA